MALSRILVTGANGMLGTELTQYLAAKGYQVTGVTSQQFNLLHSLDSLRPVVEAADPQVILHAAAYTNVDGAEHQPELAMAINKDGTQKVAQLAQDVGAMMALISTDYVFDGQAHRPYQTTDRPHPINQYGWSKYYGELMVTERMETYYIIRTAWLYGIHRSNFVQFVLDAVRQGQDLNIVSDQIGSPTWTGSLCAQIETILLSGLFGVYHATDCGAVSRFELARSICELAGLSSDHIRPISQAAFRQAATRPAYSALDVGELPAPSWQTSLHAYFQQYIHRATASRDCS
jgi:dTDP-4-dehydrorhamnose reductase